MSNPNYADPRYNLAKLLMTHRKDIDGAEALYRRIIELEDVDTKNLVALAHWNLSELLEQQRGDLRGAIEATRGYIAAGNPNNDGEQRVEELTKKMNA